MKKQIIFGIIIFTGIYLASPLIFSMMDDFVWNTTTSSTVGVIVASVGISLAISNFKPR